MTAPAITKRRERNWQRRLGQLLAFKLQHGHCDVPYGWKPNRLLSLWVVQQRDDYKAGLLPPDHLRLLEQAGFSLESPPLHSLPRWEQRFAQFLAFKEKHGHLRVTLGNEGDPPGPPGLEGWQKLQRNKQRAGILAPTRKARLDAIGFLWEAPQGVSDFALACWDQIWAQHLAQLVTFKEQHGHCEVPYGRPDNQELASWVSTQRIQYKDGRLSQSRRDRLAAVGFIWTVCGLTNAVVWERRYAQFTAFVQQHGHQRITRRNEGVSGLLSWRHLQRNKRRAGTLDPGRQARLDAIGFEWQNPRRLAATREEHARASWAARYAQLAAFQARHGHCRPSSSYCKAEAPGLNTWVRTQHQSWLKGKLLPARLERLKALAWETSPSTEKWSLRFEQLRAFKDQHGHTRVSRYGTDPVLGIWCANQRAEHRLGKLSAERTRRLDEIGFFSPRE